MPQRLENPSQEFCPRHSMSTRADRRRVALAMITPRLYFGGGQRTGTRHDLRSIR
ncbi:MAG: hypothetical protein VCF24_03030 [Candidatus Latescibacterota bacterium]